MSPIIPQCDHYWLVNAHIPSSLLVGFETTQELAWVDLEIRNGSVTQIVAAGQAHPENIPTIDLKRGLVWCCFVDLHTHLDKGHMWPRTNNPDGTFNSALAQCRDDQQHWQPEDLYRRMEFGLKCSYVHGTGAIRTHLDSLGEQAAISLSVFQALQREWSDRLVLQAAALVPLDLFLTPAGEQLADRLTEVQGLLGGFAQMNPDLDVQLDRVFSLAKERGLDLDFHTDESGNPADVTLRHVAAAAIRHEFSGKIVCGHCCSLAMQPLEEVVKTLELVKQAGIGIVSLPMCNLYLQDRNQLASQHLRQNNQTDRLAYLEQFATHTPRWRGVTLVHELKHFGIPVAFASDNCRDPFYAYGDHDGWEVFTQAVRIAQLDAPYGNWCQSVTQIPADLMGLPTLGRIGVGQPADLILFKARNFNELLARSPHDRIVLRQGKPIDRALPDYAELDDLYAAAK